MTVSSGTNHVPTAQRSGSGTVPVVVGLLVVLGLISPGAAAV
jgi:hypothetical protein